MALSMSFDSVIKPAEGVWDDATRNQFIADFVAWKAGGFPQ